jgi:hypothetical protein
MKAAIEMSINGKAIGEGVNEKAIEEGMNEKAIGEGMNATQEKVNSKKRKVNYTQERVTSTLVNSNMCTLNTSNMRTLNASNMRTLNTSNNYNQPSSATSITHNPSQLPSLLINAHATGTKQGDNAELQAIQRLAEHLSLNQIHVCATKASTGHLLAASGALEAAFSVLSLWHGWIPPTLNYTAQEDDQSVVISPLATRNTQLKAVLSNSFGFGGVNASVLFQKQEWD